MKADWEDNYEVPETIDLKQGKWIRNPYVQRFEELNLVSLDEDVKARFPDSEAVNRALRRIISGELQAKDSKAA